MPSGSETSSGMPPCSLFSCKQATSGTPSIEAPQTGPCQTCLPGFWLLQPTTAPADPGWCILLHAPQAQGNCTLLACRSGCFRFLLTGSSAVLPCCDLSLSVWFWSTHVTDSVRADVCDALWHNIALMHSVRAQILAARSLETKQQPATHISRHNHAAYAGGCSSWRQGGETEAHTSYSVAPAAAETEDGCVLAVQSPHQQRASL